MARTHFSVIRINRWVLALLLLVALAVLLLPRGNHLPANTPSATRVRAGVTLLERDFSGKTESEARMMLAQMAAGYRKDPEPARETLWDDGVTCVVPETNGYVLDVTATWQRLAVAAANSKVEPVTRTYTPSKRLVDFPQSVIRQGNTNKQAVALLVNVDWGADELKAMLPVLKAYNARVTFFVSGRWAEANKQLLQAMAVDGHEIATHGYDLRYGPKELASSGKLKADITRSVTTIQTITQRPVHYYAPHMSEVDRAILAAAADLKLRTVLYSVDTVDWMDSTSPEAILAEVKKAVPGDLILMHPKPNTAKVLDRVLGQLKTASLTPVTLSDLLSPDSAPVQPSSSRS